MAENTEAEIDQNAAAEEREFSIQRVYLKDVSFESPKSPRVFTMADFGPEIGIQLDTKSTVLGDDHYEVVLTITVTARQNDETFYLVELGQGGLFMMKGFPEEEREQMLGSYCPNILFPFAREAISDLVVKGGFPQLLLAPVNFDALYAQHLEQKQQDSTEENAH